LALPGRNLIVVADPYRAFGTLLALFYPEKGYFRGVSPRAVIDPTASIAATATIYPGAVIGPKASIGADTVLFPGVFIDQEVTVGAQSCLYANVSVYRRCRIGNRVVLHAGVVVGGDGFGFAGPGQENAKIPQTGIVQIDDDVEVGANTTIDRATLGRTWIQRGVKIDNLVQIGHNVVIGEGSILVAQVGIAGSTKLGRGVLLGGQAGVIGHLRIGDGAMIAAQSGVHKNVAPGAIVSGSPHLPHGEWLRATACLSKLPALRKTLQALVKRIGEIEQRLKQTTP
jgi:UDP-3-O-[3-hydroxymyristoyl] glucosamine N-acyltransferase